MPNKPVLAATELPDIARQAVKTAPAAVQFKAIALLRLLVQGQSKLNIGQSCHIYLPSSFWEYHLWCILFILCIALMRKYSVLFFISFESKHIQVRLPLNYAMTSLSCKPLLIPLAEKHWSVCVQKQDDWRPLLWRTASQVVSHLAFYVF